VNVLSCVREGVSYTWHLAALLILLLLPADEQRSYKARASGEGRRRADCLSVCLFVFISAFRLMKDSSARSFDRQTNKQIKSKYQADARRLLVCVGRTRRNSRLTMSGHHSRLWLAVELVRERNLKRCTVQPAVSR
jgi:hypothetical protein